MSTEIVLGSDHELIAQGMLKERGDLAKVSRLENIPLNAMALRHEVKSNPNIRIRYQELLADELQEKGLHIAERILKMAELQEKAFGGGTDSEGFEIPTDTNMVIKLSQEISRLIAEGKGTNMSSKSAVIIASKEDAKEILESILG
jgi:hypothetical protein